MQESFDWTDQLFLPRPSTTVFFRSRFGVNQNEQDFIALELAARLVEPFDRTEKSRIVVVAPVAHVIGGLKGTSRRSGERRNVGEGRRESRGGRYLQIPGGKQ